MKKILRHIILLILPFAIIIVIVNYKVDSGNIFNNGTYEKDIAAILLKNHNAEGLINYDERLVFKNIISQISTMPQVAVIGTSRTLSLSKKYFPKDTYKNYALSHSNINDIIAQVGIFDSLNKFPDELYIETTPLFACKTLGDEWLSIAAFQHYIIDKLHIKNIETINHPSWYFFKRKANALTSVSYFQSCLKNVSRSSKKIAIDAGDSTMKGYGRYSDGSIKYAKEFTVIDTIKLMANSKFFEKTENVEKFDIDKLNALSAIIKYLKTKNVKVSLIMYPFVQDFYDAMNSNNNNSLIHMQNELIDFSKKHQVKLLGTFNPREAGLWRADFYDPLHCSEESIDKIFNLIQYRPD